MRPPTFFSFLWAVVLLGLLFVAPTAATDLRESVSLFTTSGKAQNIEKLAVASWLQYVDASRLLVLVDERVSCSGWNKAAPGATCTPMEEQCLHAMYRRPLMNCAFEFAHKTLTTPWVLYIAADTILSQATLFSLDLTRLVEQRGQKMVFVGARNNGLRPGQSADGSSVADLLNASRLAPAGADVFLYRPADFPIVNMPPFLSGLWLWDSWLLMHAMRTPGIRVVDATSLLGIRNTGSSPIMAQAKRIGASYNRKMFLPTLMFCKWECTLELARVSIADYQLTVKDAAPHVVLQTPHPIRQAWRRSNDDGLVLVVVVNSAFLPMFMNWHCYVRRIQLRHYVLVAEDTPSYQQLLDMQEPVIALELTQGPSAAMDYGSLAFQKLMTQRTELILQLLKFGFWPVVSDVDILYLEDPLPYFSRSCQLQGQTHKGNQISGGLVGVTPDHIGLRFWQQVTRCQQENMKLLKEFLDKKGKIPLGFYASHTEQECIKVLSTRRQSMLTICLLPELRFVDGKSFFMEHRPQLEGYLPVALHNNWMVGGSNKIQRMRANGLWLVDEKLQCTWKKDPIGAPPDLGWASLRFTMKIRVITMDRGRSLQRLLNSLLAADYLGEKVELEILVDKDRKDSPEYHEVCDIARNFKWPFGPYTPVIQERNFGLVGQWLFEPGLTHDGHVLVVLEDDLAVAPVFYKYLKEATQAYYLDPKAYDPRLYGISLQRQHAIVGERRNRRYGSRKIEKLIIPGTQVYLYQLVGCWGQLFFRRPWNRFRRWHRAILPAIKSQTFSPCIPAFITNFYYSKNKGKDAWTVYFVYWVYYEGLYNLFFNVNGSLVTNFREKGLHFQGNVSKPAEDLPLIEDTKAPLPVLPKREALPLYDYYFEPVKHRETLKLRTNLFHNLSPQEHCFSFKTK